MNFDLTDDQTMMKEMLTRLLGQSAFEDRLRLIKSGEGWSRSLWEQLAELGVLSALVDEADGGLGGGAIETMVIAEALGRALASEPFIPSVVVASAALRHVAQPERRRELTEAMMAGRLIAAFAHDGPARAGDVTHAVAHDGGWTLSGTKTAVPYADDADLLIASAWISHGENDAVQALFLVDANAPGVARRSLVTFDGRPGADLNLNGVHVASTDMIGNAETCEAVLEHVLQHAIAAYTAEAVGLMDALVDTTSEYLTTRRQFGQPIGQFQALQHSLADMLVALEQTRSLAMYAALMIDEPDALRRRKVFAAIKAETGRAGRLVGQSAVQLHGGLGVSEEHSVGWAFKRLTMLDLMHGDAEHHVAELAALGGLVETN